MAKILIVFGATGQQGSSVVNHVLNDPELSQTFKIRAITRDLNSEKAQKLRQRDVEVVEGDISDRDSLERALSGAHTVFCVTTPTFTPDGFDIEYNGVKRVADVAVSVGAECLIFSTLPGTAELSGGRFTKVTHFDAKAEAEKYIRTLPIRSSFVSLGGFMENFTSSGFFAPRRAAEGEDWSISLPMSATTKMPLISAVEDTGKFVGAALANPEEYDGKVFSASIGSYSWNEIVEEISKATGVKVVYNPISAQDFKKSLPPGLGDAFTEVTAYIEELEYYGPGSEELINWSVKQARGKLMSFADFLRLYPLQLE